MPEPFDRQGWFGRRGWVGAAVVAVLLLGGLGGCGGVSDANEPLDPAIDAPLRGPLNNEDVLADPQTVIEGLTEIKTFLVEIKDRLGSESVLDDSDAMIPIWEDVEGRIKTEDPAAHTQFEAQFVALASAAEAKDSGRTRTAADALIALSDDYLSGKRLSTPSPVPSSSPSSTAIPSSSASPSTAG